MLGIRKSNLVFVCVTVGLTLLASKYRNNVLRNVKQLIRSIKDTKRNDEDEDETEHNNNADTVNELKISLDNVLLADSAEKCDYAVQRIRSNLSDGVLGFDCEWVNEGPVSLIQLATSNGICALFRLNKIGCVPAKLKELLSNRSILKVGVASFEDGQKITRDYDCQVQGTLDLRSLASHLSLPSPKSLAAMCVQYLGHDMDKILEVRCGDWNADTLTNEQIVYASLDAYASVLIFHQVIIKAKSQRSMWNSLKLYITKLHDKSEWRKLFDFPDEIIDTRFKSSRDGVRVSNASINSNKFGQIINRQRTSSYKSNVPTRNKPLYHNCYLQAPDGETLCTCDRKKAEWYVSKELGEVVLEDPFTVKLKFEPSGRALGEVGKYYTQVKMNQCVVCGSSDKFIRKNVVPREYRKYFPLVMKSHQSHDVLLLCPSCHEISNQHDLQLRRKLADFCDAPLSGPVTHVREEIPRGLRMLQSAVKVLKDGTPIPLDRRKELETCILKFTGQKEITLDLLNLLQVQLSKKPTQQFMMKDPTRKSASPPPFKCQPHGLKVVQFFEKKEGGLVGLEKLWREHFLNTMKPKFLPDLWSVCHNQERLNLKQTQNRIEPSDAKIAGIVN